MTGRGDTDRNSAWSGFAFLLYVARRFLADHCTGRAAGLTYTSLLALVPLLAISFAIFSAFPAFDEMQARIQGYIFSNFVPQVGDSVLEHLEAFTRQTGKLTAVGIIFLVATSVMLLMTISNTFDAVWRVRESRPLISRLLVYWAVLTLAPLFVGTSVSLSGYLFTVAEATGVERFTGPLAGFAKFLPVLFQFAGFSVLFLVMPNYPIRWRDALIGGFTAALLFEILKKLFGLYVTAFPTYETIYGALATFPIFLIWMYLAWIVVLLGAELTAALPEWRAGRREPGWTNTEKPSSRLTAALGVLHALLAASRRGGGLPYRALARSVAVSPDLLEHTVHTLREARIATRGERNQWLLSRDLETVTLADLTRILGLDLEVPKDTTSSNKDWKRRYAEIADRVAQASDEAMSLDLRGLLLTGADAEEEFEELIDDSYEEPSNAARRARILAWLGLGWIGSS